MTEIQGVHPALGKALENRGYSELTSVQSAMLATELAGKDMLVSAQTGSGKTVAFGIAFAQTLLGSDERFDRAGAPLALVVAPTRELALQVKNELQWLYAPTGGAVASCVGGMDYRAEKRTLERGVHIVVGTPGRLRDHIQRKSLNTSEMKVVVLDEADEMLDLGFREDLEFILDSTPSERQTLMFSATVPRTIANLAKRFQRDAVRVATNEEQKQHIDIEYQALTVAPNDRENAIINVLRFHEAQSAIVFCGTRATVNHLTSRFSNRGFSVVALSGELSQNERSHALQAMRDGRARVCIATDVAARGIDLPNLELVIHADIPKNSEGLLHRSGRTGRAGRKGTSVLIVPFNARRRTERLLQNAKITAAWGKAPSVDEVVKRDNERILTDAAFDETPDQDEQEFAQKLLEKHGAEKVAAAFIRAYRAGRSAPEELAEGGHDNRPNDRKSERNNEPRGERKPRPTSDFIDGVWFSLSIGRKHSAEPRWLIPMLCTAGNITKRDLGAIIINQNNTFVEFKPASVDGFIEAIGPDMRLEKTVSVKRLDKAPDLSETSEELEYPKKNHRKGRKPFDRKKPGGSSNYRGNSENKTGGSSNYKGNSEKKTDYSAGNDQNTTGVPDRKKKKLRKNPRSENPVPGKHKRRKNPDKGKPKKHRKNTGKSDAGDA